MNRFLPILILLVAIPATAADIPRRQLLRMDGKPTYIHGINLAWFDGCGHDIGPNPQGWGCSYNHEHAAYILADMKKMNFNLVRIWVFEALEGLTFDGDYVSGIHPTFTKNFDDVVALAEKNKIHLYLCLGNAFSWPCDSVLKVKNIISDPRATDAYLNNAVKPFVKRYKDNKWIFAYDIHNEPEQYVAGVTPYGGPIEPIPLETVRRFLKRNVTAIHSTDSKVLVSCGSGQSLAAGQHLGLGLDFYDLHSYNENGHLPKTWDSKIDKPVILGEYGYRKHDEDGQKPSDFYVQNRTVKRYLQNAILNGYSGTIIWDYGSAHQYGSAYYAVIKGKTRDRNTVEEAREWRPVAHTLQGFPWKTFSSATSSQAASTALKRWMRQSPTNDISSKRISSRRTSSKRDGGRDLTAALSGTRWVNSNNVTFEWTKNGRFLHNGNERWKWKVLDGNRGQVIFGPTHVDTLVFDDGLTTFKQLIRGGPHSFVGRRQ
jgi:cellulase (glycosyl hydrolase family 5)